MEIEEKKSKNSFSRIPLKQIILNEFKEGLKLIEKPDEKEIKIETKKAIAKNCFELFEEGIVYDI